MNRLLFASAIAALGLAGPASARSFVIPHLLESSGRVATDPNASDSRVIFLYIKGLPGDVERRKDITINLRLLVNDGSPLRSGKGNDVCNPCTFTFAPDQVKMVVEIQDLIEKAGGFDASGEATVWVRVSSGDINGDGVERKPGHVITYAETATSGRMSGDWCIHSVPVSEEP